MLVLFLTLCLLQALASPSASSSTLAPAVAVANLRAHELQRPPHIPFLNPPLTTPSVPRPNLRLRGGARFASRWSEEYKAAQIQLEEEGLVAYNPEEPNFDFNDGAPPAAWSIRVQDPLPPRGQHYWEVEMWQEGLADGEILEEGWNAVGLVDEQEDKWEGWWWEDERRGWTWGVHDSQKETYVSVSCPEQETDRMWQGGAYGSRQRVGLLVDMDKRDAWWFVDRRKIGRVFANLTGRLYPFATLAAEQIRCRIDFQCSPPTGFESAPEAMRFGELGGQQYGACTKPGHSERGCTGLCDIRAVIGEDMYAEIGGEEMEAAFQRELEEERQQMMRECGVDVILKAVERTKKMRRYKLALAAQAKDAGKELEEVRISATEGESARGGANLKAGARARAEEKQAAASGSAFKSGLEQAANGQRVAVGSGTFKWQRFKTHLEVLRFMTQPGLPMDQTAEPYSELEMHHTSHFADVVVVPAGCSHRIRGAGAKATLLWGRWQFRNRTEGSVQGATLMSEPPTITDDTMEVWGRWALAQCNVRAACGAAMRVEYEGDVKMEECSIGGDGWGDRRARAGIEVFMRGRAALHDCVIHHIGRFPDTVGVLTADDAVVLLERSWMHTTDLGFELSRRGSLTLADTFLSPCATAIFYQKKAALPEDWESVQLREREEAAAEDLREHFPSDVLAAREEREEREREEGRKGKEEIATVLTVHNVTAHLSDYGNGSLWLTKARPAQQRQWHFKLVAPQQAQHFPPLEQLWRVCGLDGEEWEGGDYPFKVTKRSSQDKPHKGGRREQQEQEEEEDNSAFALDKRGYRQRQAGPSGKLRCLQGEECVFQHMDPEHQRRYDHTPLQRSADEDLLPLRAEETLEPPKRRRRGASGDPAPSAHTEGGQSWMEAAEAEGVREFYTEAVIGSESEDPDGADVCSREEEASEPVECPAQLRDQLEGVGPGLAQWLPVHVAEPASDSEGHGLVGYPKPASAASEPQAEASGRSETGGRTRKAARSFAVRHVRAGSPAD